MNAAYTLIAIYTLSGMPDLTTRVNYPTLEACIQAAVILKKHKQPAGGYIETKCEQTAPANAK